MRELGLFAGAGGGLLASRLLGWRTVCAVEIEPYCQRVLAQRQRDGHLEPFPIWDDIRTFDGNPWRGSVDVVSGGFPCQAFSTAAHGRNNAPDLWPEMRRVIREAGPRWVFAENVSEAAIAIAAEDICALGYSAAYTNLPASALGAPHPRNRYWLAAYADPSGQPRRPIYAKASFAPTFAPLEWWQNDAAALGIHDGMADRLDRLHAIGNGQVPIVAATAWRSLSACLS
jgi:DNA (cytosine-5)-methyltransferase 1